MIDNEESKCTNLEVEKVDEQVSFDVRISYGRTP